MEMAATPWTFEWWIIALFIAAVTGFIATYLGVGGCFLRIPFMMWFLGLSIKQAYCVNQAVIAISTIPGVITHYKQGHTYSRGVIVSAIGASIGVFLGTLIAVWTPRGLLRTIFGSACVGVGIYMLIKSVKTRGRVPPRVTVKEVRTLTSGPKLFFLMFLAGVATGVCGFGGGIYFVPVLTALAYPMHIAVGTSSTIMIATGTVGATNLTYHGFMVWEDVVGIGLPTLLFSWLGAKAAKIAKAWILRGVFGILISVIGGLVAVHIL